MTISQQTRDALNSNWENAKQHLRTAFPGATDEDLNSNDADSFLQAYSARMGGDRNQYEQQLDQVAQMQYGSQPNQPQDTLQGGRGAQPQGGQSQSSTPPQSGQTQSQQKGQPQRPS